MSVYLLPSREQLFLKILFYSLNFTLNCQDETEEGMDQESDARLLLRGCQRELGWEEESPLTLGLNPKKVVDRGILCVCLRCLSTWLSRSANCASVFMIDDFRRLLSTSSGWVCVTHFSKGMFVFCSCHLHRR